MEILGWNKDNPGDRLLVLFKNVDLMGIEMESKIFKGICEHTSWTVSS